MSIDRRILSGILLDNRNLDTALANGMHPEDFAEREGDDFIFAAMIALRDSGMPIDVVTLTEKLAEVGELESVGGVAYIASLVETEPNRRESKS